MKQFLQSVSQYKRQQLFLYLQTTNEQQVLFQYKQMSLNNNIKSAFSNWVDGPQTKYKFQGECKFQESMISCSQSELYRFIEYAIEKRIAPLIGRIEKLENQLKNNAVSKYQCNEQNEDIFKDIELSDIGNKHYFQELQAHNHNQSEQGPIKKEGMISSTKKDSLFSFQDAKQLSQRLDQVVVHQTNQPKWKYYCKLIKNIFGERAKRSKKIWTNQQQKSIVKFVQFGHSQIGLSKKEMVSLAGVSESSFKRWRRAIE